MRSRAPPHLAPTMPTQPAVSASTVSYRPVGVIGQGSFGVVMHAIADETGEDVAIKRVRYDARLHSRELFLMSDVLSNADQQPTTARDGGATTDVNNNNNNNNNSNAGTPLGKKKASSSPLTPGSQLGGSLTSHRSSLSTSFLSACGGTPPSSPVVLLRRHPNIVQLRTYYFAVEEGEKYLHLVMNYLPTDLKGLKRRVYGKRRKSGDAVAAAASLQSDASSTSCPQSLETGLFPLLWAKLILFQIARGLAFMHARHVCHRDMKPSNVLIDPETGRVQICDFGSAKQIRNQKSERNVAYVCTRTYRAPELLFGSLHYGCEVDMWSLGCMAAEFLREGGDHLFHGATTVDHLAEIFKVLGAPSTQELYALNAQSARAMVSCAAQDGPRGGAGGSAEEESGAVGGDDDSAREPHARLHSDYFEHYNVLKVKAMAWQRVLHAETTREGVDLVAGLLCYDPVKRLSAIEVVEHPFFDDLFSSEGGEQGMPRLPNGKLLPAEAFMLTAVESQLYSGVLQNRMNREVQRISAAAARGEKDLK